MFHYTKADEIPSEVLRDLEDHVLNTLGYKIELLCKPHVVNYDFLKENDDAVEQYYINNANPVMDEVYCDNSMKPYPVDKAIVCIKANMGVGKTVELENLIRKIPSNKKMLIVSYVQTLCDTYYYAKFEKYGFKAVQEHDLRRLRNRRQDHRVFGLDIQAVVGKRYV